MLPMYFYIYIYIYIYMLAGVGHGQAKNIAMELWAQAAEGCQKASSIKQGPNHNLGQMDQGQIHTHTHTHTWADGRGQRDEPKKYSSARQRS